MQPAFPCSCRKADRTIHIIMKRLIIALSAIVMLLPACSKNESTTPTRFNNAQIAGKEDEDNPILMKRTAGKEDEDNPILMQRVYGDGPLSGATVTISKDTFTLTGQTDEMGFTQLKVPGTGDYLVTISYYGYENHIANVNISDSVTIQTDTLRIH